MSIFSDILPKIVCIPKNSIKNIRDELQGFEAAFQKLEDDYFRAKPRDRAPTMSLMTTLQSIDEDEDETRKSPEKQTSRRASKKRSKDEVDGIASPEIEKRCKRNASIKAQSIISTQVNVNLSQKLRRESPAEARRKRDEGRSHAVPPVKIKQEKISLPPEPEPMEACNAEPPAEQPPPSGQLSTEQLSSSEKLLALTTPLTVSVKREPRATDVVMPPPAIIPPKRRGAPRQQSTQEPEEEESARRSNRQRKPKDLDFPAPPTAVTRASRASARAARASSRAQTDDSELSSTIDRTHEEQAMPPPEARPKRTRAKKKLSESSNTDAEKENAPANIIASPNEKPRPKRTRRGQKAAEKELEELEKAKQKETNISPKEERISAPQTKEKSPVLQKPKDDKTNNKRNSTEKQNTKLQKQNSAEETQNKRLQKQNSVEELTEKGDCKESVEKQIQKGQKEIAEKQTKSVQRIDSNEKQNRDLQKQDSEEIQSNIRKAHKYIEKQNAKLQKQNSDLEKQTKKLQKQNSDLDKQNSSDKLKKVKQTEVVDCESHTPEKHNDLNSTMVLPNGVYSHLPVTPQNVRAANATVTLQRDRDTLVLAAGDATVVLERDVPNVTDDNSLLTDDGSVEKCDSTPPREPPKPQPTSAVKQKVQQFEQLAARTTRTKTRQLEAEAEAKTPPLPKPGISLDTLERMRDMIFSGKPPTTSSSAIKPRANGIPVPKPKPVSASANKASALSRQHEESLALKEDARKKKEAMLEAKREQQRRKREEKIAAAAAAREAVERQRKLAMEAAVRERQEKQAHADQGKIERLKEVERKKLEQARKVAETEERRRAEEQARQQRLAEEQKKAEAARKKQLEETEAMKKDAAMAKEIERRQKEYLEKQKLRQMDKAGPSTPGPGSNARPAEPTYMQDGFQYLVCSDEEGDHEPKARPQPAWASSKARNHQLSIQAAPGVPELVSRLFPTVRPVDLREIFPAISRHRLVRTSSAVWRTPPKVTGDIIARIDQVTGGVE